MAHAILSPSSAARWLNCPGSVVLSEGIEDKAGIYADEGSCAHWVGSECLTHGGDAWDYVGKVYDSESGPITVTAEMAEFVQVYINNIRQYATIGTLFVEQAVSIGHITGEVGAVGTGDAIIITDDGEELQVHDLKYGRGVAVSPIENDQLMMYALGSLADFEMLFDIPKLKRVLLVIHQPRVQYAPLEWECAISDLLEFADRVGIAVNEVYNAKVESERPDETWRTRYLNPGPKQCQWCRSKAHCPALQKFVIDTATGDFDDLTTTIDGAIKTHINIVSAGAKDNSDISNLLSVLDLIEAFCTAVRVRAYLEIKSGNEIPEWKLVSGKRGARAWIDGDEAEKALKSMRLKHDEMYNYKVISPTQAEKLLKESPRRWNKLIPMIEQPDGSPTLVPASDKRAALVFTPVVDDFDEVPDENQTAVEDDGLDLV